jgi:hypothetical protein
MIIKTLWGERKGYEGQAPELMIAWDEYSLEQNYEGFEQQCQQAIESWGDELVQWRIIEVAVADAPIFKAFEPTAIAGSVT